MSSAPIAAALLVVAMGAGATSAALEGPSAALEGPTATTGLEPPLRHWQAAKAERSWARDNGRPDFRVERTRRISRYRIRVCWSEPGGGPPETDFERDQGCDTVERRHYTWWIHDSVTRLTVRWL